MNKREKNKIIYDILNNIKNEKNLYYAIENEEKIFFMAKEVFFREYAIGDTIEFRSNIVTIIFKNLTKDGYLFIDNYEKEMKNINKNNKTEEIMKTPSTNDQKIKLFISHSSEDAKIIGILIELFQSTISNLSDKEIRCTSVVGYDYTTGEDFLKMIKNDTDFCNIIITAFSENSLKSPMVLFECGIGWYLDKVFPIFIDKNLNFDRLPRIFTNNITRRIFITKELKKLIQDIAKKLKLELNDITKIDSKVNEFIEYFANNKLADDVSNDQNKNENSDIINNIVNNVKNAAEIYTDELKPILDKNKNNTENKIEKKNNSQTTINKKKSNKITPNEKNKYNTELRKLMPSYNLFGIWKLIIINNKGSFFENAAIDKDYNYLANSNHKFYIKNIRVLNSYQLILQKVDLDGNIHSIETLSFIDRMTIEGSDNFNNKLKYTLQ